MAYSINIILFGNPHGMSQIGVDSYKYYEKTFYKTYTKEMPRKKFLISRLPDNTAVYTLVEYDLIAGKRPGGFFGMELRVEGAFHQQTEELIKFFEEEYVKHVEGNILQNTKDNGRKYCINNFSEREDVWQALLRDFQVYVDTHFTLDDSVLRRLLYSNSTWEKVIEPGKAVSIVPESNPISDYETRFSALKEESDKLIIRRQSETDKRTLAEIDNALRNAILRLSELQNKLHDRATTIPETKALIGNIEFQVGLISSILNKQIGGHGENNSERDTKTDIPFRKTGKHFPSFPSRLPLNNILCGVLGFVFAWFLFGVMELGRKGNNSEKPAPGGNIPNSLCEYYEEENLVPSFKDLKEAIQSATKNSEYDKIRSIIQKADSTVGRAYSASVKSALYEAAGRVISDDTSSESSSYTAPPMYGVDASIDPYRDTCIREGRKAMVVSYNGTIYSMNTDIGTLPLPNELNLHVRYPNDQEHITMKNGDRLDFGCLTPDGVYHIILTKENDTIAETEYYHSDYQ